MQRWYLNADRNDGFSATVSPLALASLLPIVAFFAHEGIKPHFSLWSCLRPSVSSLIVHTRKEGAMFQGGRIIELSRQIEVLGELLGWCIQGKSPTHISSPV